AYGIVRTPSGSFTGATGGTIIFRGVIWRMNGKAHNPHLLSGSNSFLVYRHPTGSSYSLRWGAQTRSANGVNYPEGPIAVAVTRDDTRIRMRLNGQTIIDAINDTINNPFPL